MPPVVYVAAPPQEALRSVPFVAPMPPNAVFFPASDPQLYARIVHQIEYYFRCFMFFLSSSSCVENFSYRLHLVLKI